ncbi:SIS domain-containing protein [Photobacterium phosphoreum]|jgi:DNA-binding MurR/RpiR family transcriptional regulator|uniref:SIS domain-containing protein n=1 Tax=Photobacterium phosphoreum TaxID=659 RepID=A0AAW5A0N1_PHOPO|nr:MurR/RpiR family transcriptional regulator [Photobacterium phosphoreum]MCD9462074.1 MurR/RpiR family transcriptional regulator [Photobacterium phosphoreum]MCD9469360.1 MurR/RpiR family transcriptional regulator [Photobacterium phosphoreum]MCD9475429.1 SIS domain-containing protein [Photobacterium phosphoreum]MCD9484150.1 SIS domain-containing protein [Photobacterium phosphoreum]MCD9491202.1 SIS domain-containing protein [Photobacterium phosphoreum]
MNTAIDAIQVGKILDTLGSLRDSLTPSARRIADYVLAQPQRVTELSIAELSQQAKVGEASIIRFCRVLNFKGFQDLKMKLAIEVATPNDVEKHMLDTELTADDNAEHIGRKLQQTINNVLGETLNLLDFSELEAVARAFQQQKRIYFFGVGSSGITAEDAKNKLMRIGLDVDALTNNHFMYMKASLLSSEDIAIGISHSGTSKETIKALALAKACGAITVALTHNPLSPLAELSDHVLINGNRQGQLQGDSIGTKITQLFVLDMLYTLLVRDNPEHTRQQKYKTTQALD